MRRITKGLWEIYRPFRWWIVVMLGLLFGMQGVALVAPYLYGMLVDGIIAKAPMAELMVVLGVALGASLVVSALGHVRELIEIERVDFTVRQMASHLTLTKVLRFSLGQHHNQNSGVKLQVINKGEASITTLAYTLLYDVIPLIFEGVIILSVLLAHSVSIGSAVFGGVLVFLAGTFWVNQRFAKDLEMLETEGIDNQKVRSEFLRNVGLVKIHAQEERAVYEYDARLERFSDLGKRVWTSFCWFANGKNLVINITKILVIGLTIFYVYRGMLTAGKFVVFLSWTSMMFMHLNALGPIHRRILSVLPAIDQYFKLLDIEPEVKVIENPVRPEKILGRIEFRNVTFLYPSRDVAGGISEGVPATLEGINFSIEPGQRVAFVGSSGAGKSTIINLLLRAYDPTKGQVVIDGNDLRILDLRHYLESVGFVEQDVAMFDNTLRYNILFGLNGRASKVSQSQLDGIAEASCLNQFFGRLEKGYDTLIGEKGIKLSGGERQRVGIARALVKEPRILIFDEATSNLDSENETHIRKAIERVSVGRTTIIVAHRLSTVKNADKIFVVEAGRIVGSGTHDELVSECPRYRQLVAHQLIQI